MSLLIQAWVWQAREGESETFRQALSEGEKQQADRFFHNRDRARWTVSRARTRQLLGEVMGVEPASIAFGLAARGRPFVVGKGSAVPDFNVSHSENVGVLAVSYDAQVGVDVEAIRPIGDDEIAWALSPDERDQLERADPAERLETFFRFWTLKEAFMKGTGLGASLPLHDFDIRLDGPRLQRLADSPGEPERWRFAEAVPAQGTRAAIAARTDGQDITVTWRHLS